MFTTFLKKLSLDDLIKELVNREKQLALCKKNKADNHLIEFNKRQLEKVQSVIVEKTGCDIPLIRQAFLLPDGNGAL